MRGLFGLLLCNQNFAAGAAVLALSQAGLGAGRLDGGIDHDIGVLAGGVRAADVVIGVQRAHDGVGHHAVAGSGGMQAVVEQPADAAHIKVGIGIDQALALGHFTDGRVPRAHLHAVRIRALGADAADHDHGLRAGGDDLVEIGVIGADELLEGRSGMVVVDAVGNGQKIGVVWHDVILHGLLRGRIGVVIGAGAHSRAADSLVDEGDLVVGEVVEHLGKHGNPCHLLAVDRLCTVGNAVAHGDVGLDLLRGVILTGTGTADAHGLGQDDAVNVGVGRGLAAVGRQERGANLFARCAGQAAVEVEADAERIVLQRGFHGRLGGSILEVLDCLCGLGRGIDCIAQVADVQSAQSACLAHGALQHFACEEHIARSGRSTAVLRDRPVALAHGVIEVGKGKLQLLGELEDDSLIRGIGLERNIAEDIIAHIGQTADDHQAVFGQRRLGSRKLRTQLGFKGRSALAGEQRLQTGRNDDEVGIFIRELGKVGQDGLVQRLVLIGRDVRMQEACPLLGGDVARDCQLGEGRRVEALPAAFHQNVVEGNLARNKAKLEVVVILARRHRIGSLEGIVAVIDLDLDVPAARARHLHIGDKAGKIEPLDEFAAQTHGKLLAGGVSAVQLKALSHALDVAGGGVAARNGHRHGEVVHVIDEILPDAVAGGDLRLIGRDVRGILGIPAGEIHRAVGRGVGLPAELIRRNHDVLIGDVGVLRNFRRAFALVSQLHGRSGSESLVERMARGRAAVQNVAVRAVGQAPCHDARLSVPRHDQMHLADRHGGIGAVACRGAFPLAGIAEPLLHAQEYFIVIAYVQIGAKLKPDIVVGRRIAQLDPDIVVELVLRGAVFDVRHRDVHADLVGLGIIGADIRGEPFRAVEEVDLRLGGVGIVVLDVGIGNREVRLVPIDAQRNAVAGSQRLGKGVARTRSAVNLFAGRAVGQRPCVNAVLVADNKMHLAHRNCGIGRICAGNRIPGAALQLLHADENLVNTVHVQIGAKLQQHIVVLAGRLELDPKVIIENVSLLRALDVGKIDVHAQLVNLGVIGLDVCRHPVAVAREDHVGFVRIGRLGGRFILDISVCDRDVCLAALDAQRNAVAARQGFVKGMASARGLVDLRAGRAVGQLPCISAVLVAQNKVYLAHGNRGIGRICAGNRAPCAVLQLLHADKNLINAVLVQIGT